MDFIHRIGHMILIIIVVSGVYQETGEFTAFAFFLVAMGLESTSFILLRLNERVDNYLLTGKRNV